MYKYGLERNYCIVVVSEDTGFESNRPVGSGIGLYIVKNAVDKLGGQISVASRVGQGTRFNIILPNRINSVINKSPVHAVEQ